MGRRPPELSALEAEFVAQLKRDGKSAHTVKQYRANIRGFMRYVGNEPLHRVTEEQAKHFFKETFGHRGKQVQMQAGIAISQFLKFAVSRLPAPVTARGSEMVSERAPTKKELALRQRWAADKLNDQKEAADDLIAQLARKLIDHYLYFQARMKGEPENLDDVVRFTDECRDLIERNLPLFMGLSAGGRNVHSKIDERVQR